MPINLLIQALGSSSLFTSRAFLPAFLTALSLRYGHAFPFVAGVELIENAAASPTWFTHGGVISILGALAGLEFAATKNADARLLMDQFDTYSKTAMAAITSMGVLSVTDLAALEQVVQEAGFGAMALPLIAAAPVFFFATVRSQTMGFIAEADPDDELGIQKLLAWLEDAYVGFGFLALLIFPMVMLPLLGLALGALFVLQKALQKRELATRVDCLECGELIFPCATECQHCQARVEAPTRVGALGQPQATACEVVEDQVYRLAEKKRCPACATRLGERSPRQSCEVCGHELNKDAAFTERYIETISQRLPGVLLVTFGFSLIPVLGLIPGIIYYRIVLIAPFRGYLPFHKRLLLKIGIALFFTVLISIQWVPLAGGLVLPLMAWTNFVTHRSAFRALTSRAE